MLQAHILPDHEAVSRHAADWLAARLRQNPSALICLAAGSTPTRTYEILAQAGAKEPTLFAHCRIIKLDEWGGLPPGDPATCDFQLRTTLVSPLNLAERYVAFDSDPPDPEAEAARVAVWLDQNGPIDISVLGLGINGHLGFTEPAEYLQPFAHVAQLSQESLAHAMLAKSNIRPTYGLTLGMADLIQSRHILLLVTGPTKRDPLKRLLSGRITTEFPASMLQLHSSVQLLCDAAAAQSAAAAAQSAVAAAQSAAAAAQSAAPTSRNKRISQ
jgi:galactosamine-6-phosphate isomerase